MEMTDNFKIIYKILTVLEAAMDYPEFDTNQISAKALDISNERWARYIEMLEDSGYVKGAEITENIIGETEVDISNIRITIKGLEYLSENSIMQRMYRIAKGIKDITPGI